MATSTPVSPNAFATLADFIEKTPAFAEANRALPARASRSSTSSFWVERMGMSPAQVVAEYPHLTMAQVHAALAYYWSHDEEIQRDIESEEKAGRGAKGPGAAVKIQEKVDGRSSLAASFKLAEVT